MLLDAFLDMLLTLGILILAGIIAVAALFIVFTVAIIIKGGVETLREKKDKTHD